MLKKLGNRLAYIITGILIAMAGTAYAAVSVPNSTQKGAWLSGLLSGNYQVNAPCSNGQILAASSTSSSGWACVVNTAALGATTTITSNIQISGPDFTFATSSATGLNLNITGSGSTLTFSPTLQSGYVIPISASTTEWSGLYNNLYSRLIVSTSSSGTLFYVSTSSLGTLSINYPANVLSTTTAAATYEPILTKGNLTATSPLQFDNTRQVIGGAAAISVASGYAIPTTASSTGWDTAHALRHAAVTLAGENYLSISGQQITAGAITLSGSNVTGVLPIANGGTGTSTAVAASQLLVGNGTNYDYTTLPSCSDTTTSKLLYNTATRTFTCGTDQSGGGGSLSGGTVGFAGIWASSTALTIGALRDNGTVAGVGATSSSYTFNVQGSMRTTATTTVGELIVGTTSPISYQAAAVLTSISIAGPPSDTRARGIFSDKALSIFAGGYMTGQPAASELRLFGGAGNADVGGAGGKATLQGGDGYDSGAGGDAWIIGGTNHVATSSAAGGNIIIKPGHSTGSVGKIRLYNDWFSTYYSELDLSGIGSSNKTFTFPNQSGTIALTSDLSSYVPYTYASSTFPSFTYASSSYFTLFNTVAGSNIVITTSTALKTIAVSSTPTFTSVSSTNASTSHLTIAGSLYDSYSSRGALGEVLQSTATSTKWVATSTLGISGSLSGGTNGFAARWTSGSALTKSSWLDNGVVVGFTATSSAHDVTIRQSDSAHDPFQIIDASGNGLMVFTGVGAPNGGLGVSMGLGTSTPAARLHVVGAAGNNPAFRVSTSTGATLFTIDANGSTTISSLTAGPVYSTASGALYTGAASGGSLSGGSGGKTALWSSATTLTTGLLLDGTVSGVNATSSTVTFNLQGTSNVTPFVIASSTGHTLLQVHRNGSLSVGTTTSVSTLFVQGTSTLPTLNLFQVASSSGTSYFTVANNGSTTLSSLNSASCDVMASNGSLYCGTNGGSASSTIDQSYWPIGPFQGANSTQITGSSNQGVCSYFTQINKAQTSGAAFYVSVSSGTSTCSGGTCGFQIGIYNSSKTLIAASEVGTSATGTAAANIRTPTGTKRLNWLSGSAVSAGKMTLDPGNYWMCYSTDSTAMFVRTWGNINYTDIIQDSTIDGTTGDKHGYKGSFSTGNGASLALPSSWSGTLTASGSGAEDLQVYFYK